MADLARESGYACVTVMGPSHGLNQPAATLRWKELDCANSSDALLMNIFCPRRALRNPALNSMLGIPSGLVPQFGLLQCNGDITSVASGSGMAK
jgi:hypothetical protein